MLRLLAAFAALLLPAAPAAAAAVRPHTRVATYARNGITVRRLQAAVTPAGARLRVAIRATVRDDGHLVRAVTVRAGACTGGSVAVPSCPDAVTFEVPVAAGRTSTVRRTISLAAPPRALDRVQVMIARHGALPRRGTAGTYGVLLLDGRAWRGAGVGRAFGADLTPRQGASLQRLAVDAAGLGATRMRAQVAWTARSRETVTLGTGLAGEALRDKVVPAGGRDVAFLARPAISVTPQPSAFTALVRTSSLGTLATVRLPWPSGT